MLYMMLYAIYAMWTPWKSLCPSLSMPNSSFWPALASFWAQKSWTNRFTSSSPGRWDTRSHQKNPPMGSKWVKPLHLTGTCWGPNQFRHKNLIERLLRNSGILKGEQQRCQWKEKEPSGSEVDWLWPNFAACDRCLHVCFGNLSPAWVCFSSSTSAYSFCFGSISVWVKCSKFWRCTHLAFYDLPRIQDTLAIFSRKHGGKSTWEGHLGRCWHVDLHVLHNSPQIQNIPNDG